MLYAATRDVHHLQLPNDIVAWCVDDQKLAYYDPNNDSAWLASPEPCTLRDWT
jgi:hypothetical protein